MDKWVEQWPSHWVKLIPVSNERVCISVFRHRDTGSGPLGGLSRWVASLESPWVGGRWTLNDDSMPLEKAQAQAAYIAYGAVEEAYGNLGKLRDTLAKQDAAKEEG